MPSALTRVDQRLQPVGELLLIRPPVAQAGVVDVAAVEPAVVHDEQLDAHLRRELGDGDLRLASFTSKKTASQEL